MIVCPNCNHPNPDGAVQCEACYTPLPATVNCPSCGATVQADASFCGQCGFNLRAAAATAVVAPPPTEIPLEVPPLAGFDPLIPPQPVVVTAPIIPPESSTLPPTVVTPQVQPIGSETVASLPVVEPPPTVAPEPVAAPVAPEPVAAPVAPEPVAAPVAPEPVAAEPEITIAPDPEPVAAISEPEITIAPDPEPVAEVEAPAMPAAEAEITSLPVTPTQLQQITALLIHIQSDRQIELPQNLSVIHIGKTNDRIPPDIDISGFPNSEVVSRIHADIRIEGDAYYIEDAGSSNGTYVNNLPLLPGNRHRLRPGDRVGLGKGDLVTFLFQLS
ncbi:FHA domain-containing protein [Calothrix sp. PCC 6303]|uniref:FHA domain-containing protein n=1 Tax=Calothrix sp. PCC 6303 TaxID=1170562 RepID=UPI0002A02BA6|nr:FHA domain-containing protein [Calothrix sp. PCC 6303]AFZ02424.1 FHA domain containing protein [Calothrix sp. PCC 6303]